MPGLYGLIAAAPEAVASVAVRGKDRDYRLNHSPDEYNVKSVLEPMEGMLVPVACLGPRQEACPRSGD